MIEIQKLHGYLSFTKTIFIVIFIFLLLRIGLWWQLSIDGLSPDTEFKDFLGLKSQILCANAICETYFYGRFLKLILFLVFSNQSLVSFSILGIIVSFIISACILLNYIFLKNDVVPPEFRCGNLHFGGFVRN